MKASSTAAVIALVFFVSGSVQHAAALRQLSSSPLLAYPWMPWKDDSGAWQKPAETSPDFSSLTLMDLPPPELYIQVALTSPFPVPQLPLERIINNTIVELNNKKLPKSAKDWVQMAGNAGNFVARNMPSLLQRTLETFLEGITLGGQPLMQLPALKDTPLDAAKALRSLPQLLNITMAGMELSKLQDLAEQLNIKLPNMPGELNTSLEELKKLPGLLQFPKEGLTIDDIKRVPAVLEQVASAAANAADAFTKQLQGFQLPRFEDLLDEGNMNNIKNFLSSQLNVNIPDAAPVQTILVNITKAIPQMANQLGVNIEGLDKLPGVMDAMEKAFTIAKEEGLVIADKSGRIDIGATISRLPDKIPLVQQIVSNIAPAPIDLPKVHQSLEKLQKSLTRLADMTASVMRNPAAKRAVTKSQ